MSFSVQPILRLSCVQSRPFSYPASMVLLACSYGKYDVMASTGGNATENPYVCVSNSAGYLRLTLANASSAKVEYVLASDSSVFDEFTVLTTKHGPFSLA